jgi:hypothetical protein
LVAGHLSDCASCRRELASLRAMWREMALDPPGNFPHEEMRRWLATAVAGYRQSPQQASSSGQRSRNLWPAPARRRTLQVLVVMGLLAACLFAAQQSGLFVVVRQSLAPQVNSAPTAAAISPNGTIEGTVVMRGTATPLAGVQLALLEGGDHRADAVTNGQGHFTIKDVTPGAYEVHAFGDGLFGNPNEHAALPEFESVPVTVEPRMPVPPVRLSLIRGGSLGGRVVDADGQPISRASVKLYQAAYRDGYRTWATIQSGSADSNGMYWFPLLPPGEYFVALGSSPEAYYPGTLDPAAAKPISLRQGATLSGINLTYPAWSGVRVSGRVTYAAGIADMPAVDAFMLESARTASSTGAVLGTLGAVSGGIVLSFGTGSAGSGDFPNLAADQRDGQFEIQGVLPGVYDLSPGDLPSGQLTSGARIDVRDQDIHGVQITIGQRQTVNGTLSVRADGKAIPLDLIKLDLRAGDYRFPHQFRNLILDPNNVLAAELLRLIPEATSSLASLLSSVIEKQPDPVSGAFTANLLPGGKYKLIASGLPPNTYIADIRQSGKSVFDDGFYPESDGENALEVILDTHGAALKGSAETADRKPARLGVVALVPAVRRQNMALYKSAIIRADSELKAEPKSDGQFSISGIAPGDYKIFAWEHVPPEAWKNADFMKQYETRGKAITIGPNGASGVRVTVIPWEP